MKLVSCILPVNRDTGYLDAAVASVLAQTHASLELIIVANGATDLLWHQLQAYTDPRIRLLRSAIGQLPHALNLGIDAARGEYIARMDADDLCLPERFARQAAYLDAHPDCQVVGSRFRAIAADGRPIPYQRNFYGSHDAIVRALPYTCPLIHPTVMMRRDFLLELRGYSFGFYAEDHDLWLRARRAGCYRFHNLPDELLLYRVHPDQASGAAREAANLAVDMALRFREWRLTGDWRFLIGMLVATRTGKWLAKLANRLRFGG